MGMGWRRGCGPLQVSLRKRGKASFKVLFDSKEIAHGEPGFDPVFRVEIIFGQQHGKPVQERVRIRRTGEEGKIVVGGHMIWGKVEKIKQGLPRLCRAPTVPQGLRPFEMKSLIRWTVFKHAFVDHGRVLELSACDKKVGERQSRGPIPFVNIECGTVGAFRLIKVSHRNENLTGGIERACIRAVIVEKLGGNV